MLLTREIMTNPWLAIPLEDYEGHMALPDVGQARMLADEFGSLLKSHVPDSVAIVGCAGGNGFDKVIEAGVPRLIGIDINANYIADAKKRYGAAIPDIDLLCIDIQEPMPSLETVDLVYAALLFEYVNVTVALKNISTLCKPHGILAALLQLPKEGAEAVTPSQFSSLQQLGSLMKLVPPDVLNHSAAKAGMTCFSQKVITLASGKRFSLHLFKFL
jgi:ubiquinone/menaquinone biosynthesis C-methylase UbiE